VVESDTSLEESAALTSRRTSLTSLQEVTKCLDDGNYDVHTSMNALKFRSYYSKYISEVPFGLDTPDTTAIKTMRFLTSHQTLASNLKHAKLKQVRHMLTCFGEPVSEQVDDVMKRYMTMLWKQADIEHRTGEQNAYHPVTDKDLLHLTNSILLEQGGNRLTYQQVHTIFIICFVQNTSRRFMELLCVTIPDLELKTTPTKDGSTLRSITFKSAYDKNLGFSINEQTVGEGRHVHQCPVLWTLLLLKKLGVIKSALEAWDTGTLEGKMSRESYVKTKDLVVLLKKSHTTLNRKHKSLLTAAAAEEENEWVVETVWDEAMTTNQTAVVRYHWMNVGAHTRETISKVATYTNASGSLGPFVERYGYISTTRVNFSLTGARKEYEQGSFNPVVGN
jgi:hypothetical protein